MTENGFASEWRKVQWYFVHVYFGDKQVRTGAACAVLFHSHALHVYFMDIH
jgi:hypothetical protein